MILPARQPEKLLASWFQANLIVHGILKTLFASKVTLGGLNRDMTE
jgi:hypothetical protein